MEQNTKSVLNNVLNACQITYNDTKQPVRSVCLSEEMFIEIADEISTMHKISKDEILKLGEFHINNLLIYKIL